VRDVRERVWEWIIFVSMRGRGREDSEENSSNSHANKEKDESLLAKQVTNGSDDEEPWLRWFRRVSIRCWLSLVVTSKNKL
jgi:hypothetical protein